MVRLMLLMKSQNKIFNHLKIHTQYSICEGAIKIEELQDFCKKNKLPSIGISDTANLCGALEFSENISKVGTQPIIGTQINFNFDNNIGLLTLIAMSEKGYKNMVKLSSSTYINNNDNLEQPNCKIEDLFHFNEDIIVLSGSLLGLPGVLFDKGKFKEIEKLYRDLKKVFTNRFYIEIQRHNDKNEKNFEQFNLQKSKQIDIPIIASDEIFYLHKDMYEAHDALICIGNKTYIQEKNRIKYSKEHYIKPNEELIEIFKDLPEALENNFNLPKRCSFRPRFSDPVLPDLSFDKENTDTILENEASKGLIEKFKKKFQIDESKLNQEPSYKIYKERLNHELKIITNMKYSSYFLIVSDYIKWAKKNDIPVGPGRGSGAGSLVAWCLSITDIDPIKFDLIFERFLNPDRISMPDFDIDFCEEKRDLVFKYLKDKYKNSVAHIITFGKLKARMVVRDVGRVMGLSYGFVDNISKMIPFDPSRPLTLTENINREPRLQKLIKEDERVKKLMDISLKLEGLNRNVATHAAGVVIADKELTEFVPLYKDNSTNLLLPSTQFDMYSAENAGLIKFDFLGLKTLTVINKTEKLIKKKTNFEISEIDYNDQNVYDFLSSGQTVGLFQLESSGMREALINMKPNRLEDIIALVALYRPGPMSNIPTYNDCKHGRIKPDYLHPLLEEILKPTYGVIIYQEQVMQIAQKLSGFSAGQADILRKAMGKKKRSELEKQKEKFIDGAVKNGIKKEVAASIFLKIEPFAEYGFNKSHAAAYAIIAYQTAFLKKYYPNEFFAASMTMDISNQKKLGEFYDELKRLKIAINRPNINDCYAEFKSDEKNFYYALGAIKAVGYEAINNIVNERLKNGKFKSLDDFVNRVDSKDINKLQLEGLVKAGAFDCFNENRKSLYEAIPVIILRSKNIKENKSQKQINLFENVQNENENLLSKINDWEFQDRLAKEFEAIGFFISDHPLSQYKETLLDYKILDYKNFSEDRSIKESNIAATILKIQEKKTQKGNSYAILKLTDLSGVFELFVFSEILETNRSILKEGNSLMIAIYKNLENSENRFKRINIRKISLLNEALNKPISEITINLKSQDEINKVYENINKVGDTKVKINYNKNGKKFVFQLKNKRKIEKDNINALKKSNIAVNIS